jgi:RimJ/RimL family protein N-acetyltransferase
MGDKQQMPDWASNLLFELSPQWWIPLEAGGVVLRIPDASDTKFLKETFGNTDFMHRYHRFQGASDEAVESFISNARLSPRRTGRLDWIVLDQNDKRVGLFAFVDIDWKNNRGEALIGFPVERSPAVSLKASVAAMEFAFRRLGLQKIVSYVYADNPEAQANTLHFGFVQEGLLRNHIQTELGRCDIFVNGLTPSDFAANGLICSLARRWIRENTPHLNAQSPQEPSVGGGTASGMGANVRALVTFTPVNAGAYYLGVRGVPVN